PAVSTPSVAALHVVPSCGGAPGFLLAQMDGGLGTKLRVEPFRGGMGGEYVLKDGQVINAGCVAELQADASSKSRQLVVLGGIPWAGNGCGKFTAAIFDCAATQTPCVVPLPTNNQAAAFLPGTEERLIGTTFDATGAQLTEWVMQPVLKNGTIG